MNVNLYILNLGNMFLNVLRKIKRLIVTWRFLLTAILKIAVFRSPRMVFLFGSPVHSNMGDQAQSYCLQKWFEANYPGYGIYFFRLPETNKVLLDVLQRTIRRNDKLVCHSGYHLTDLYHEQDVYCDVAQRFRDRPIWIFPQTICYKEQVNLEETAKILNHHGRITLMVRDDESYKTAKKYFTECNLILFPDIVTSLIGTRKYNYERNGVLFCFRNDVEAFYTRDQINSLKQSLGPIKIEETDTTLNLPGRFIIKNRENVLNSVLDSYSKYKLIITDRYHGTIFSLITGTPVIVLKTTDHKLSSGVRWFPDSFKDYVMYAQDMEEAKLFANVILNKQFSYQLPSYFKDNYYDKLKELLENA